MGIKSAIQTHNYISPLIFNALNKKNCQSGDRLAVKKNKKTKKQKNKKVI
ncbi:MAG: hypothetical protein ACI8SR_003573, partial [Oceanicoccus sp.]